MDQKEILINGVSFKLNIDENALRINTPSNYAGDIGKILGSSQNGAIDTGNDASGGFIKFASKEEMEQFVSSLNVTKKEGFSPSVGAVLGSVSNVVNQSVGSSDTIKFDPAKLLEASEKLSSQHERYIQCVASIKRKAENLLGSWQGDSSALYIDKIKELDSQSSEVAETLRELAGDLAAASGIYKTGESDAKKKAEALPTDGVFLV